MFASWHAHPRQLHNHSKETPEPPAPLRHAASAHQRDWLATDRKPIQTTIVREWKERWQREVDRSRARHRGRAEEPADEPPAKERLKLHEGLQKAESSLLIQMRTDPREDRTPSLPVRTSGVGCDDPGWRGPGNSDMWQHIASWRR